MLKRVPGASAMSIRRLGPGECFGEIALLGDHVRTATTRSVTAVNLLAVDREAFEALFSTLPPLRTFFERLIQDRMAPAAGLPQADGVPSAVRVARASARQSESFR